MPVVLRFARVFDWHAEVAGLFLRELGQLHADAIEVQAGDFFIQSQLTLTWKNSLIRGQIYGPAETHAG